MEGVFAVSEGMFISSTVTNAIPDVEKEICFFIDSLFNLIEVKK